MKSEPTGNDSTESMRAEIDRLLPDEALIDAVRTIIFEEGDSPGRLEFDDGPLTVPRDAEIEIVTKAFFREAFPEEVGFGAFRVRLAIGGFRPDEDGLHTAGACFVTLYLNDDREIITVDFDREWL